MRIALALILMFAAYGLAQDRQAAPSPASAPAAARPLDRAALEKRFAESLADVVLDGTFRMSGAPDDRGRTTLGPAAAERYSVRSAVRAEDDFWVITARVQYGEHDVELPIRLRVVWAEDAPIITLDELFLPGLGTYSARVMIFRDYYAGTWFGGGCGGVLSGQIVPAASAASQPANP